MRIGKFQIDIISDGGFALDGGAMFGVVPKSLWSKVIESDQNNRIPMGLNCLLIRSPEKMILVDTGIGDKFESKYQEIYKVEQEGQNIPVSLEKMGIKPEDIDIVINSHLHFDHCGRNTRLDSGKVVATFPNAKYLVSALDYDDATHPNERTKASYFMENYVPLYEKAQMELVDLPHEVVPGVRMLPAPGHTRGLAIILVEDGGEALIYWADLIPMTTHLPIPWVMSYDLDPVTTMEQKKRYLAMANARGWIQIFEHDFRKPLMTPVEYNDYLEKRRK